MPFDSGLISSHDAIEAFLDLNTADEASWLAAEKEGLVTRETGRAVRTPFGAELHRVLCGMALELPDSAVEAMSLITEHLLPTTLALLVIARRQRRTGS